MGGGISIRDEKTIDDFKVKLKQKKWWDDSGHSGIECKIWVEVQKDGDIYVSEKITIRHAYKQQLDQYHYNADKIKDIEVKDNEKISVRVTDNNRVDFRIDAYKL